MKSYHKCLALVLFAFLFLVLFMISPLNKYSKKLDQQTEKGHLFLRSLTAQDVANWIQWAYEQMIRYEQEHKEGHVYIDDDNLPKELKNLGLLRLYVSTDMVVLIWVGGMGNTSLNIRRESDGTFRVVAWFTDELSKELWHDFK